MSEERKTGKVSGVVNKVIPVTGMRKAIATHMAHSAHTTARVTHMVEVDATELLALRERLQTDVERDTQAHLSLTHLLVKAVGKALEDHRMLRAQWAEDGIHLLEEINIGLAIAIGEGTNAGLIVPVVHQANTKTVGEIAQEVTQLIEKVRAGRLSQKELTGSVFTITNLGMYGIDIFTPIINAPECAILGVGRIVERPMIYEGEIVKRSTMWLSLSFDHRIVDGANAAEFLAELKSLLESPDRLLAP